MIKPLYIAACDVCGAEYIDKWAWPSISDAIDEVVDWPISPDGVTVCDKADEPHNQLRDRLEKEYGD